MTVTPSLLLATSNRGKFREIRYILGELPARFVSPKDFPGLPEPDEDGATFEENALKKALYYAGHSNLLALADDSGLEVDALGGAPGVHSARYAGRPHDDAVNNAKLIAALAGVPPNQRTARFRCVAVLARGSEVLAVASGVVEGLIVDDPRGVNGFGYDPHFLVPEVGMTAAEMPPELKNRLSHRARALESIRPRLVEFLG